MSNLSQHNVASLNGSRRQLMSLKAGVSIWRVYHLRSMQFPSTDEKNRGMHDVKEHPYRWLPDDCGCVDCEGRWYCRRKLIYLRVIERVEEVGASELPCV